MQYFNGKLNAKLKYVMQIKNIEPQKIPTKFKFEPLIGLHSFFKRIRINPLSRKTSQTNMKHTAHKEHRDSKQQSVDHTKCCLIRDFNLQQLAQ